MSVRSAGGFSAAVIPGSSLVQIAKVGLWVIAGMAIITSILGNYVQFNGGWERWGSWDEQAARAMFYALAWQTICTMLQFAFLKVRLWPAYFVFLLGSAVPSFLTYDPLAGPVINTWLVLRQVPDEIAGVLTAVMVMGGVGAFDWLPERILVRKG